MNVRVLKKLERLEAEARERAARAEPLTDRVAKPV